MSLMADQRALVYAMLCLGRLHEIFWRMVDGQSQAVGVDSTESREDVMYYRNALSVLDAWGSASLTALRK